MIFLPSLGGAVYRLDALFTKSMKLAHFLRFLFHLQAFCWVGYFLR